MRRVISDISYSVVCPNNGGPAVFTQQLSLPDEGNRKIEGWISNFGSSNVHLLSGQVPLTQAQSLLTAGFTDMLMTLSGASVSECELPDTTRSITVFFEAQNTSGQTQVVTFRIKVTLYE